MNTQTAPAHTHRANHLFAPSAAAQPHQGFAAPTPRATLNCESPLRVAAATLARATDTEITATTVVGVLGLDDINAFQALLARVSDEFDLEARARISVGSYVVRFSRRLDARDSAGSLTPSAAHQLQPIPRTDGLVGRTLQRWVYLRGRRSQLE